VSNKVDRYNARRPYFFNGVPSKSIGHDGDFAISKSSKGLSLYLKYENRWLRVSGLENLASQGQGKYIGSEKKTFKKIETDQLSNKKDMSSRNISVAYDHSETQTSTIKGIDLDINQEGITASGQYIYNIGIDVDVDTSTPTNVGTTYTTGADIYAKGGGSGTSDAIAIKVQADGADSNIGIYSKVDNDPANADIKMVSSANTSDYCTIKVGAEGATTITTVDADTDVAHLTIDADGDINLDAVLSDSGDGIGLKNAGTMFSAFQIHHSASWLYLYENGGASTTDHLALKCAANGASTISTNDGAGTDADLTLDVDGSIHLDSEDGIVNFKNSGTNMATFSSNRLRIHNQTDINDYFNINVGTSASTIISTIDDAGTSADLAFDAGGDITLDSATGKIYVKDNGGNYTPGSDYEIATKKYVDDNAASKQFISGMHRFSASADNKWYGGYNSNFYKSAEIFGLDGTSTTDTSIFGWSAITYSDFMAPTACTVTAFNGVARQDNASSDVELSLWKVTILDNNSHTASQACDFIGSITWAANADTTSVHALHNASSIDGTAANLDAGDMLILGFRRTSGTDANYWYIRWGIEITHG